MLQVPALLSPGVTIVITPLVSLLKDQLLHLAQAAVEAAAFTGAQEWQDQRETYDSLRQDTPGVRILFLTPEKACNANAVPAVMMCLCCFSASTFMCAQRHARCSTAFLCSC